MDRDRFPELIADLYRIVGELEAMFPGRHFTPDGHLVGSLGECLAAYHYGLELLSASSPGFDAVADGRNVEIKATQGKRVALRSGPEHLLVLSSIGGEAFRKSTMVPESRSGVNSRINRDQATVSTQCH